MLFYFNLVGQNNICQFQFTKRQFFKISIRYIQYYKELCDKFTNQCCDKPNNLHSTMRHNL